MLLFSLPFFACSDYDLQAKMDPSLQGEDGSTNIEPTDYPNIEVQPNPLTFSSVLKDCPADPITVSVTNYGYETLSVSDVSFMA